MSTRYCLLACCALIASMNGCSRSKSAVTTNPKAHQIVEPIADACALLTKEEIESIQTGAVQDTKPSRAEQGGLAVAQCYISLPKAADSLNLTVMQSGSGPDARDPKELWNEQFHRDSAKEPEGEREAEEKTSKAEKIEGLGDEAFWVGDRFGGAIYALKGNAYIRLSVGGPGDREAKIKNCKTLAGLALGKL